MKRQDILRGMAATMLTLQAEMNAKVNPEWMTAGYNWNRAAWIECAGLMDHVGWKWWKKQAPDIEQASIEAIDILHFGLSALLVQHGSVEAVLQDTQSLICALAELDGEARLPVDIDQRHILKVTEFLAVDLLCDTVFPIEAFTNLVAALGMSTDDLFRGYVGKNVLNKFRQDNGYKDGTYIKDWAGREDNVWLAEIVAQVDGPPDVFADAVYERLAATYAEVVGRRFLRELKDAMPGHEHGHAHAFVVRDELS